LTKDEARTSSVTGRVRRRQCATNHPIEEHLLPLSIDGVTEHSCRDSCGQQKVDQSAVEVCKETKERVADRGRRERIGSVIDEATGGPCSVSPVSVATDTVKTRSLARRASFAPVAPSGIGFPGIVYAGWPSGMPDHPRACSAMTSASAQSLKGRLRARFGLG